MIRGVWRLVFPALLVAAVVILPTGFVTETKGSANPAGPSAPRPPGGPILVDRRPPRTRSASYYGEILRAEGLNEFAVTDIARRRRRRCSPATTSSILGDMTLTAAQVGDAERLGRTAAAT